MRKLIFAICLLIGSNCMGRDHQVDPSSLDSLKRSIENSRINVQAWQDSFNKKQDSIYQSAITRSDSISMKHVKADPLPVQVGKKEKRLQYSYVLAGIGIVFFILLVIVLSGKTK